MLKLINFKIQLDYDVCGNDVIMYVYFIYYFVFINLYKMQEDILFLLFDENMKGKLVKKN